MSQSRWYRVLAGVGIGAGIAAAVAAIIASILMWAVRSPRDSMSLSLTSTGAVAVASGVCVLTLVGTWLLSRHHALRRLRMFAGFIALGLGAWSGWNIVGLYRSREALPFVDSTGAAVIAAAAALCAIVAVLAVATTAVVRDVSGRTVLCSFLVVALVIASLTYWSVRNHRAGVWRPELTATASAPAPVPDAIGPVGYRIPIGTNSPDIYAVGNGFVVDTRRGLTAYDGTTGAKRWHVGDYGRSGRILVVHRNRDDTAGIVVVFLYYGMIAFDGSSGDVLWRRQYNGGEVTAAAGSVDALGMSVFTGDYTNDGQDGTRFYSLDPATGQLRSNRTISCSNPTIEPGAAGQFGYRCGRPSIMDAHTGNTIDVPGEYAPRAGTDAYVVATPLPPENQKPKDATRVMDPAGRVIDEIPGTYPVSEPNNGLLFVYGGNDTWLLRDYRNHRSTRVPFRVEKGDPLRDVETIWFNNGLLVTNRYEYPPRFHLVSLTRPADIPAVAESPCPRDHSAVDVQAGAGAIFVQCRDTEVVGLVPEHR